MLATLKVLITLLTPASITLKDIQPELGSIVQSYPDNTHLKPKNVHFSHIDVVQRYGSEQVAYVDLTLTKPILLEELAAKFGEYKIIVPDDRQPNQAIFYIKQPTQPSDIALIATLNRQETEVTAVTLRRDVHTM